ncbi:MAG TPA: RagB/SusD family nutrient uptake outer membrane protein [Puia sp.]|nr:RagB/SusD family nutrient uptake outer membrane protein [Puia sp.]
MKYITFGKSTRTMGLTLATTVIMLTACKKLIEIPPNPPNEITASGQFADSATTMTAMAFIYSYPAPQGTGFAFNDGDLSLCTGLSADELSVSTGASDPLQLFQYGVTPLNSYVSSLWVDPYSGMYPVNAALSGIAASAGLSASLKTQLTGELRFVRALYNFYLVNVFGAVPVVTTTDYVANSRIPRASVDSVNARIVADLQAAQQVLPAAYISAGHLRPNLYTVKALLAKVYLYQKNWQAAYNAADAIIQSGGYTLEPNLKNVFLDGSKEAIWQLPAVGNFGATMEAHNYVPQSGGTTPRYPLTSYLVNTFEPGDQRLRNWAGAAVVSVGPAKDTFYYPYKYKNIYPGATKEDFMIFRLGEQYLIHAEAAAELGNLGTAISDLNIVRARAGLGATTATSQADVLTAIMHERQTELFCEWGNRWLDLNRTGAANTILNAEKGGFKPYMALYPVPLAQIQANNSLTQNPGYN